MKDTIEAFDFKEIDEEGLETLEAISNADNFNKWMFDTIFTYCGKDILEIGSGIGNISQFFFDRDDSLNITVSDLRENYRAFLSRRKTKSRTKPIILDLDVVHENFDELYKHLFAKYDTIFALNVVEHIKDDKKALANCEKLLKKGGRLIILVPAYQSLYNSFDTSLEHYRRYTAKTLVQTFPDNLKIIHTQYFNAVGILGWFFSGNILGKKIIPANQMNLYNQLVPFIKLIDTILFNKVGLSVITVGEKL